MIACCAHHQSLLCCLDVGKGDCCCWNRRNPRLVKRKDDKTSLEVSQKICPGITAVVGGRPKPSPCLKLYSFLQAKSSMPATVTVNGEQETYTCPAFESSPPPEIAPPTSTLLKGSNTAKVNDLAFTRSGDKVVYF